MSLTLAGKERTGLRRQIEDYFARNEGEELSRADMLAKFGCNQKTLDIHLKSLKAEGILEVSPRLYRRCTVNAARP